MDPGSDDHGETFLLARNELDGDSELAGPTFSRDRQILFADVRSPGHAFAIRGRFRKLR